MNRRKLGTSRRNKGKQRIRDPETQTDVESREGVQDEARGNEHPETHESAAKQPKVQEEVAEESERDMTAPQAAFLISATSAEYSEDKTAVFCPEDEHILQARDVNMQSFKDEIKLEVTECSNTLQSERVNENLHDRLPEVTSASASDQRVISKKAEDFNLCSAAESKTSKLDDSGLFRQDGRLQGNFSVCESHVNTSIMPQVTADNALKENKKINDAVEQEACSLQKELPTSKDLVIIPEVRDAQHSEEVEENVYDQNKLTQVQGEHQNDNSTQNLPHGHKGYDSYSEYQKSDGCQSLFLVKSTEVKKDVLTTTEETSLGLMDKSLGLVEDNIEHIREHVHSKGALTLLSDLKAPREPQLQDSCLTTDEHTEVDFSFKKRKMASSRKNKGRRHVRESEEDIFENTVSNEPLGTPTVYSEIKETGQEEVSEDTADDIILSLSHGSSVCLVPPHDLSSEYPETDSQSFILKSENPQKGQDETNSEILVEVVGNSDVSQDEGDQSDTLHSEDTIYSLSDDVLRKLQKVEVYPTQMQESLQIQHSSETVPCHMTKFFENISENLKDQSKMSAGKSTDNIANKQKEHQKEQNISEYTHSVQLKNERYDLYDTNSLQVSNLENPSSTPIQVHEFKKGVEDDIKLTTDQIYHQEKRHFFEMGEEKPVLFDSQPQEASWTVDEQSNKTLYNNGNRRKLGSCRKIRGKQQDKDPKEKDKEKTSDEETTQIFDTNIMSQEQLRLYLEHDVILPVSHDSSVLSTFAPGHSLEDTESLIPGSVSILESQEHSDINMDLSDKSWEKMSGRQSDTQSKSGSLQSKDVIGPYPNDDMRKGQEHESQQAQVPEPQQMDYTVDGQEGEGGIFMKDTKHTSNSRLQDNTLSTDEQTDAGFSGSRRKLGSSQKNIGRRQGEESKKEVLESARDDEILERPTMLMQEELTEDNEPRIIMFCSNNSSLFPNPPLDQSFKEQSSVPTKYPETDLEGLSVNSENLQGIQNESKSDTENTVGVSQQAEDEFEAVCSKDIRHAVAEDAPKEVGGVEVHPTKMENSLQAAHLSKTVPCDITEDVKICDATKQENYPEAVDVKSEDSGLYDTNEPQIGDLEKIYPAPTEVEEFKGRLENDLQFLNPLTTDQIFHLEKKVLLSEFEENKDVASSFHSETGSFDSNPQGIPDSINEQINTGGGNRKKLGSSQSSKEGQHDKKSEEDAKGQSRGVLTLESAHITLETKMTIQEELQQDRDGDLLPVSNDSSIFPSGHSSEIQSLIPNTYSEIDLGSLISKNKYFTEDQDESETDNDVDSFKKSDTLVNKSKTLQNKEVMDPEHSDNAVKQAEEHGNLPTDTEGNLEMDDTSETVAHDVSKYPETVLGDTTDQAEIISNIQSELTVKSTEGSGTKQEFLPAEDQENLCSTTERNLEALDQTSSDDHLYDSKETSISSPVGVNTTLGKMDEGGSLEEGSEHNPTDSKLQDSSLITNEQTDVDLNFNRSRRKLGSSRRNKGRPGVKESKQEVSENTRGGEAIDTSTMLLKVKTTQQEELSKDIREDVILSVSQDISMSPILSSEDQSFVVTTGPGTHLKSSIMKCENLQEDIDEQNLKILAQDGEQSADLSLIQCKALHSENARNTGLEDITAKHPEEKVQSIMQDSLQMGYSSETASANITETFDVMSKNLTDQGERCQLKVKGTDDFTEKQEHPTKEILSETLDLKNEEIVQDDTKPKVHQIFHEKKEGMFCEIEDNKPVLSNLQPKTLSLDPQPQETSESADEQISTDFSNSTSRRKLGSSHKGKARRQVNEFKDEVNEKTRVDETPETTLMSLDTKTISQEEQRQNMEEDATLLVSYDNSIFSVFAPGDSSEVQSSKQKDNLEAETDSSIQGIVNCPENQNQSEIDINNELSNKSGENTSVDKSDFLQSKDKTLQNKEAMDPEHSDNAVKKAQENEDLPTDIEGNLEMDYTSELVAHDVHTDSLVFAPGHSSEIQSSMGNNYHETDLKSLIQENSPGDQDESELSHRSEEDSLLDKSDFLQSKNGALQNKEVMDPEHSDNAVKRAQENEDLPTDIEGNLEMDYTFETVAHDIPTCPETVLGDTIDQAEIISNIQSELTVKSTEGSGTKQEFLPAEDQENLCSTTERNLEALDQTSSDDYLYDSKETSISSPVGVNTTLGKMDEGGSLEEGSEHSPTDSKLQGSSLITNEQTDVDLNFNRNRRKLGSSRRNKGRPGVKESKQEVLENPKSDETLQTPTISLETKGVEQERLSDDTEHKIILSLSQDLSSVSSHVLSLEDQNSMLKNDPDTDLQLLILKKEHFGEGGERKSEMEDEMIDKSMNVLQEELGQSDNIQSKDTRDAGSEDALMEVEKVEIHQTRMQDSMQPKCYSETVAGNISENEEVIPENMTNQTKMSELTVKATDDSSTKEEVYSIKKTHPEALYVNIDDSGLHDINKPQITNLEKTDSVPTEMNEFKGRVTDDIKLNTDQIVDLETEGLCEMKENSSAMSNVQANIVSFDSQPHEFSQNVDEQPNKGINKSGNRRKLGSSRRGKGRHQDKESNEELKENTLEVENLTTSETKMVCEELKQDLLLADSSVFAHVDSSEVQNSMQNNHPETDLKSLIQENRSEDLQTYSFKTFPSGATENFEVISKALTDQTEVSELNVNSIDDTTSKPEASQSKEIISAVLGLKNEETVQHDVKPNTDQIFHPDNKVLFCEMEENTFALPNCQSENVSLDSQPLESSESVDAQTKVDVHSRRKLGSSRRNKGKGKAKDIGQPIIEVELNARMNELDEKATELVAQDQEKLMGIVLDEEEENESFQTKDVNIGTSGWTTEGIQQSPTFDQEDIDTSCCTQIIDRELPKPHRRDHDEYRELCMQVGNVQESILLPELHACPPTAEMHAEKSSSFEHTEPESGERDAYKKALEQEIESGQNQGMFETTKKERDDFAENPETYSRNLINQTEKKATNEDTEILQPKENLQSEDLCEPPERTTEKRSNMYHAQVEYSIEQGSVSSPQAMLYTDGEENRHIILSRAAETDYLVDVVNKEQKEQIKKTEQMPEMHQISLPNDESLRQTLQSDKDATLDSQPQDNYQDLKDEAQPGFKAAGNKKKLGSSRRNKGWKHGQVSEQNQKNKDKALENTGDDETTQVLAARQEELENFMLPENLATFSSAVTEKLLEENTVPSHDVLEDNTIASSDFNSKQENSLKSNAQIKEKYPKPIDETEDSIQLTGHDTNKKGLMQSAQASVLSSDSDMQSILFHDGIISLRPDHVHVIDQEGPLQRQNREALSCEKDPSGAEVHLQETNKEIETVGFITTEDCSSEVESSMDVHDFKQDEVEGKCVNAGKQKNTSDEFISASQEPAMDAPYKEEISTINTLGSQGEKTQVTSKQKKRKIGSSRRTPMNRKQEGERHDRDQTEESDFSVKAETMNMGEMEVVGEVPVNVEVLQGEDVQPQQETSLQQETPETETSEGLQSSNMSLVFRPEQSATIDLIIETPKPDYFTRTETQMNSEVAERHRNLSNQSVSSNTGTPGGSLELFFDLSQSTKGDEHSPENVEGREIQDVQGQMPSSLIESIHSQNPGMRNASPDLTPTNRRRKMGSTRKNLGTRTKQEILESEKESTDIVTSSGDVTVASVSGKKEKELQLHTEHTDDNSHQGNEKETVEISQFGESLLRALAEQTAEESSVTQKQAVETERQWSPSGLSSSPSNDTSESAFGGRRKKFGSNRKSGLQQRKQDQTEDETGGFIEEGAHKAAEREESPGLRKISEVDENEKASSSTSILKATGFSKPVRDKTSEKLFNDNIRLDQESRSQLSSGTTSDTDKSDCYNVVMIGESCVGKTSFMKRAQSGKFSLDLSASVGLDSCKWTVVVDGKPVVLQLWDTAGQERFHSITRQVFHKAQAFLLMYDITSSQSFSAVSYWANSIQEAAVEDVTVLLLGNKCEHAKRQVKTEQGDILAKEYNFEFMECSAATGENVIEALEAVARMLSQRADLLREEVTVLHKESAQRKRSKCC